MPNTRNVQAVKHFVATILIASGSSAAEAGSVADNLVMANLSGHDSHGVGMLPRYLDAVREGGLQPNAAAKVLLDTASLLTLDGQRGYGQVVGVQAIEMAIARALEHGSCIMTLAQAHHLGRIGHFAEMATARGLVAIHFVNVISRPVVAPWGGGDGRFGTNPMCIGIPLPGQPPFVLDFATSRVAQGKMRVAHNEGRRVDLGYVIDAQGKPTTDPGVVVVPQGPGLLGALMSFGEHKGYGLAVACELLGGALSGGGTWHGLPGAGAGTGTGAGAGAGAPATYPRAVVNSMLSILIDPAKLGTQQRFEFEAAAFIDWLRQCPPGEGFDAVQIAGEPERAARAARSQAGLSIDAVTWAEIVAAARSVGVTGDVSENPAKEPA